MIYDTLHNKKEYDSLISSYPVVKVTSTNYSVRYEIGNKRIMLNETGERPASTFSLMNDCKNDARRYLKQDLPPVVAPQEEILWYCANSYEDMPQGISEPILKIDLSEAYWRKACQMGIISKKTQKAFKSLLFASYKEEKLCRLKALGSLATIRTIKIYKKGKLVDEYIECEKPLRNLYLAICELVSQDMQKIITEVGGLYYYWDCVFVRVADNKEQKIVSKIEKLGYKCRVEKDNAVVINNGQCDMLYCEKSEIGYPLE